MKEQRGRRNNNTHKPDSRVYRSTTPSPRAKREVNNGALAKFFHRPRAKPVLSSIYGTTN